MLKTLVLERIHKDGIEAFKSFSSVFEYYDKTKKEIKGIISGYNILIIKSTTKIDKSFLDQSINLKVIARAGTGLDNIDLGELKKRNIKIFSVKRGNTLATAEYIIGLIFLLIKNFFLIRLNVEQHNFSRHKMNLEQLNLMNVGIIGMGNLGYELALRLEKFGCKLYSFDQLSKNKKKFIKLGGRMMNKLDNLLKKSDIVILAASLNKTSRKLINEKNVLCLKNGSYFINCARANLIDQDVLLEALNKNIIKYAALDLIDPEPVYKNLKQDIHPLIKHPNVFYSPHIAGQTVSSQKKISVTLAKKVKEYFKSIEDYV